MALSGLSARGVRPCPGQRGLLSCCPMPPRSPQASVSPHEREGAGAAATEDGVLDAALRGFRGDRGEAAVQAPLTASGRPAAWGRGVRGGSPRRPILSV